MYKTAGKNYNRGNQMDPRLKKTSPKEGGLSPTFRWMLKDDSDLAEMKRKIDEMNKDDLASLPRSSELPDYIASCYQLIKFFRRKAMHRSENKAELAEQVKVYDSLRVKLEQQYRRQGGKEYKYSKPSGSGPWHKTFRLVKD